MNDESIKLILQELRKVFPYSNFHLNLRVFKDGLFGLSLIQNIGDQRNDFLFVQASGTSLIEVQQNLFVAVLKLIISKRDEMNSLFLKETNRVMIQNNLFDQSIQILSEANQ